MKLMSALIALALALCLVACAPQETPKLAFRDMNFSTELSWSRGGENYSALVEHKGENRQKLPTLNILISAGGEPSGEAITKTEYLSPGALGGLSVERWENGERKISLGSLSFELHPESTGGASQELAHEIDFAAEALFAEGAVCKASNSRASADGKALSDCLCTEVKTDIATYTYYLDRTSGFPRAIKCDRTDGESVMIEIKWVEFG